MSRHDYTPEQALDLILQRLQDRDASLAAQIQDVFDAGKDVLEVEPSRDRRKKARRYRRTVPLKVEEALRVALNALQAYFVEQPLFAESALSELATLPVGLPSSRRIGIGNIGSERELVSLLDEGIEKQIDIELLTETQIRRTGQEVMPLKRGSHAEVDIQRRNIDHLRSLLDFS